MKIHVYNRQKDISLNKSSVRALVKSTLEYLSVHCREVAIYFVSEKKISELHEQFFQDPTPTDCISFPLDQDYLGEVFVCPAVAHKYANAKKLKPYDEIALYIIHGLLHLIGFDDLEEKERRTMRKKEKSCMQHLDKHELKLSPK